MPSEKVHISIAVHNQRLIDHLLEHKEDYPDWLTTVAFYKAVHIVEAVFYSDDTINHCYSHEERDRILKETNTYRQIYKFYRPLKAASMVARYLEPPSRGQDIRNFSEYLSPGKVVDEILNKCLREIEKSASRNFLSKEAKDMLNSQASKE